MVSIHAEVRCWFVVEREWATMTLWSWASGCQQTRRDPCSATARQERRLAHPPLGVTVTLVEPEKCGPEPISKRSVDV